MNDNNIENLKNQDIDEEFVEDPSKKKKNKKLNIISVIFIVAIFIALGIYMIKVDGLDNIINLLKSVDYSWVLARYWCLNFMVDL